MKLLRQNTQTIVDVGPILGADFLTVQTAVTLVTGHAELFQAAATAPVDISTRAFAHISGGVYQITLTSGDLSGLGPLMLNIHAASTQPLAIHCNVLQQGAYDTLCGGGNMPSNVMQIFGSLTAALNLGQSANAIVPVTIGTAASTTIIPTNLTVAVSQFYNGRTIVFVSGACAGQAAQISAYNGATKQLTVTALTTAPGNGDAAVIV